MAAAWQPRLMGITVSGAHVYVRRKSLHVKLRGLLGFGVMDKGERDHNDNQGVVSVGRCFNTPVHPVRSDHGPGVREDVVQLFPSSAAI